MRCEEIMQEKLEIISQDDAVLVAADRMRRKNIGFLPVCDHDGKVIGTLTDRDIAVRLVAEDLPAKTPVRNVMSNEVVACRANDDVHFAEELMAQKHKSRILCLDGKDRPVGVVSLADIAQWETERAGETLRRVTEREAKAGG